MDIYELNIIFYTTQETNKNVCFFLMYGMERYVFIGGSLTMMAHSGSWPHYYYILSGITLIIIGSLFLFFFIFKK